MDEKGGQGWGMHWEVVYHMGEVDRDRELRIYDSICPPLAPAPLTMPLPTHVIVKIGGVVGGGEYIVNE